MAESKIEIKVGEVSFSGEGDGKWLSDQLDKILTKIPELTKLNGPRGTNSQHGSSETGHPGIPAGGKRAPRTTLASFLKEKAATANQIRKFLAVAVWLHDQEHKNRLTTREVTGAISDANQKKLGNAADSLNQNVRKGFCEKDGKEFYVTDDGRAELN